MILVVLGGAAIGVSLGVFGSGGSILTVPVLLYLLGHPERLAVAESLGIVGAIALTSAFPYARQGMIDWRSVLLFGGPGVGGTYLGAWLSRFVSGPFQIWVFIAVMALAAILMLTRATPSSDASEPPARKKVKIALDGLLVGALTGFVGVGGGFLIVPALVFLGGLSMRRAVATSLVIISLKSAAGFWAYWNLLKAEGLAIEAEPFLGFILFGTVGSWLGHHVTARWNSSVLERVFALLLLLIAAAMAVSRFSSG